MNKLGEISNKGLALIVLASLVVVIVGTSFQIQRMNSLTGMAGTEDTGIVNLSIGSSISIEVDPNYDTIDFGTCTPNASGSYIANSSDGAASVNCSGDTATDQFIELNNIGNVKANISVVAECLVSDWLVESGDVGTSSDNFFQVAWENTADCEEGLVTTFGDLSNESTINACDNLTVGGAINMSAAVLIDSDTQNTGTCGADANTQNTITFTASQSGT